MPKPKMYYDKRFPERTIVVSPQGTKHIFMSRKEAMDVYNAGIRLWRKKNRL
jgi:hypothetical protein